MGKNQDVVRLFMMPRMAHCRGGEGPDQVNFMAALERWREQGVEPKVFDRDQDGRLARGDDATDLCGAAGGDVQGYRQHP